MTVQVLMNKFSCAKEVYKIAIIRWRIAMGDGGDAQWATCPRENALPGIP